jgi:hypothetical protein
MPVLDMAAIARAYRPAAQQPRSLDALLRTQSPPLSALIEAPAPEPEPPPAPLSYQGVLDEQREADAMNKAEMKIVLREKLRAAATGRDWTKAQRLAAIHSELEQWSET